MYISNTTWTCFMLFIYCVALIKCGVIVSDTKSSLAKEEKSLVEEVRKKNSDDLTSRILLMIAMPFITQLAMLPMTLVSLKFMLMKSMFLGKMAIFFGLVLFLRNWSKNDGAFYSHNVNVQAPHHS